MKPLLFLLFIPTLLSSQELIYSESNFIKTIVVYRSKLLLENIEAADNLRVLEKNWGQLDSDNEEFKFISLMLIQLGQSFEYPTNFLLKQVKKECTGCKIAEILTEEEVKIILENSELLDLVQSGMLKPNYPFTVNPNSDVFKELEFYKIAKGDKIAELGAGNGTFSIILGLLSKEINIAVNEIEVGFLQYIKRKLEKNDGELDASKFELIEGKKSSANLPENQFDKVIIRNAFHHFSKKEKMLASIKEALKKEGKLFLYEPVLTTGSNCEMVMSKKIC
ncbi:MAG: class I SAM-dependent methyltransferase [Saprospiraceae bacterium]